MTDIKQQIFQELSNLEEAVAKLRGTAIHAGKQTDLEVAILNEQVRSFREKNARAVATIDQTISILKKLKK
jgi:predicted  nucleic acid-binding Zn-ribbon protein